MTRAHIYGRTNETTLRWGVGGVLLQGRVLLGLNFYRAYLPCLLLICFRWLVEVWILSGSHYLHVAHIFWDVCLKLWSFAPLFLFSLPFLGAFFSWSLAGFHQTAYSLLMWCYIISGFLLWTFWAILIHP